jgi:hypothetical protein
VKPRCRSGLLGELEEALSVYWNEAERCRKTEALWALLHVTVCIPDICAALRDGPRKVGEAGLTYRRWCDDYLGDPGPDGVLTSAARWEMRNKVLHESLVRVRPRRVFSVTEQAGVSLIDVQTVLRSS